jgi:hypothetical protein
MSDARRYLDRKTPLTKPQRAKVSNHAYAGRRAR